MISKCIRNADICWDGQQNCCHFTAPGLIPEGVNRWCPLPSQTHLWHPSSDYWTVGLRRSGRRGWGGAEGEFECQLALKFASLQEVTPRCNRMTCPPPIDPQRRLQRLMIARSARQQFLTRQPLTPTRWIFKHISRRDSNLVRNQNIPKKSVCEKISNTPPDENFWPTLHTTEKYIKIH